MEQEQPEEHDTKDYSRRDCDLPLLPPCRWLGKGPQWPPTANVTAVTMATAIAPFAPPHTALAVLFPL